MGNVVVWKQQQLKLYSANVIMQVFKKQVLPDGVINMVMGDSGMVSDVVLSSPHLAGVHFTGSTGVFNDILENNRKQHCYTKHIKNRREKLVEKISSLHIHQLTQNK